MDPLIKYLYRLQFMIAIIWYKKNSMESLYIKEKRLQSALEKLKNLNYLPNAHTQEVDIILV